VSLRLKPSMVMGPLPLGLSGERKQETIYQKRIEREGELGYLLFRENVLEVGVTRRFGKFVTLPSPCLSQEIIDSNLLFWHGSFCHLLF
jgi:hypothetical protein